MNIRTAARALNHDQGAKPRGSSVANRAPSRRSARNQIDVDHGVCRRIRVVLSGCGCQPGCTAAAGWGTGASPGNFIRPAVRAAVSLVFVTEMRARRFSRLPARVGRREALRRVRPAASLR